MNPKITRPASVAPFLKLPSMEALKHVLKFPWTRDLKYERNK